MAKVEEVGWGRAGCDCGCRGGVDAEAIGQGRGGGGLAEGWWLWRLAGEEHYQSKSSGQ